MPIRPLVLALLVVLIACRGEDEAPSDVTKQTVQSQAEPQRGGGTDFDDELDPLTPPLAGIALCTADGPCQTPDNRASGPIKDGRPHGLWTLLGPDGARVGEMMHKDGQPDGLWQRWSPDGTLLERGPWVMGKPHGIWTMYRHDGTKFETVTWAAGLRHGPWTMFHPNGKPSEEMVWKEGRQVGVQTDYAPSGARIARGQFEDHRPAGAWTCWTEDGAQRTVPAPTERLTPSEACGYEVD